MDFNNISVNIRQTSSLCYCNCIKGQTVT